MNMRLLGALAAICAVAILVLLIGTGLGWWTPATSQAASSTPLAVRTALDPNSIFFGDPIVAQVAVDLDTSVLSPDALRVVPNFEPFVVSGAPRIEHSRDGRLETVRYTYALQCVSAGCLPTGGSLVVKLPPVVVTAVQGGKRLLRTEPWPTVLVASRLRHAEAVAAVPHFQSGTLPAPVWVVPPGLLADILVPVGAMLAAGAFVLLAFEFRSAARRRHGTVQRTRLEAALAYVRESARRKDPADRRKALELLAAALAGEGQPTLAESAERLAWAEQPPTPERTLELAEAAQSQADTQTQAEMVER